MTRSTPKPSPAIARRARLAQIALFWERCAPILWPSLGVFGALVAAALAGVSALLGGAWPFLALGLGALGVALAVRGARDFRAPTFGEALRKIEKDAGLRHRPLTGWDDRPVREDQPFTRALWTEHRRRTTGETPGVKGPRAKLAARDPYGLRFVVIFAIIGGGALAGEDWSRRLLTFGGGLRLAGEEKPPLDAWISPPEYTRVAPIFLARDGVVGDERAHLIPQGSVLNVKIGPAVGRAALEIEAAQSEERVKLERDPVLGFSAERTLTRSGDYRVRLDGRRVTWAFGVIPDAPPTASLTETPTRNERGLLQVEYAAEDDYGVAQAELVMRLDVEGVDGADDDAALMRLSLDAGGAPLVESLAEFDLTDHPWAGLPVAAWVEATDEAGQTARSREASFTIPARLFTDDLARAADEQRRGLVLRPEGRVFSAAAIDALTAFPDPYFSEKPGAYLALRGALAAVLSGAEDDIERAQDYLWTAALLAEGDDVDSARRAMEAAQRELMEALASGAPEHEINDKLAALQQAINRYVDALTRQAMENMAQNGGGPGGGGSSLQNGDIAELLEQLRRLSETGSVEAAQELLAELSRLLENLRIQLAQGSGDGSGSQAPGLYGEALDELSGLIGEQRQLQDQTSDRSRGEDEDEAGSDEDEAGENEPGDGAQGAGENGAPRGQGGGENARGPGPGDAGDIADLQERLAEKLDELRGDFNASSNAEAQAALDAAERAMRRSAEALRNGDLDRAIQEQRNAVENLRDGAQRFAQEELETLEGELASRGGEGGEGAARDPLGRRAFGNGLGSGSTPLPSLEDLGTASEILEELRRRARERDRSEEERRYLERLLDRFRR